LKKTKKVVPNHIIETPDPNVTVVQEAKPLPVEMVIRGYITGSAWRAYEKGEDVPGANFPKGLKKNAKLPEPVITPSTKATTGHDEAISRQKILEQKLVPQDIYDQMEKYTHKLYDTASKICAKNNIILVDTKYEFGLMGNKVIVIDEIHTPDSSRFWIRGTYEDLFSQGKDPEILDKEFFRGWLMDHGFKGDGQAPVIPDDVRVELAQRYVKAFETITGQVFKPVGGNMPIMDRILKNLAKYFQH
jgi:phosphoribosylaminoimidazole-succinocarboxamide synthase